MMEKKNTYLADFLKQEKDLCGNELPWVRDLRKSSIVSFSKMGFPTNLEEEWKYTNVDPIAETEFVPAQFHESLDSVPGKLSGTSFLGLDSCRLTFINGRYSHFHSSLKALPEGMLAGSLAGFLKERPQKLEPVLGRLTESSKNPFTALNNAFFEDGAFIFIPRGTALEFPIHLLFISAPDSKPAVSYPRVLIVAESDTKADILENYLGLTGTAKQSNSPAFNDPVTEIEIGENSNVNHYKFQQESLSCYHVASVYVRQNANSNFTTHSVSLGGSLARNDLNVLLSGQGCECQMNGLYKVQGDQQVDNHTVIDHAQPHCSSRELYKGILDGKARAVFNGRIIVRPDAQKTDAHQSNKNLLLSDEGQIHSNPELMIYADDVKCKHGATVGQLDSDALFYLRSRGLTDKDARRMLIDAFAYEMTGKIPFREVRNPLMDRLTGAGELP